jgi:cytochrome c
LAPAEKLGEYCGYEGMQFCSLVKAIASAMGRKAMHEGNQNKIMLIVTLIVAVFASEVRAQDAAAAGEKVFAQCRACHQIGENAKNAVGPILNGLIGRKSGMIEGYNYSDANKNSGIVWDEAVFAEYIRNPRAKVPGTKMTYAGLTDEKKIQDLIAFLKQYDASGKRTQ